ncbi:DUF3152 domain-containing protein [Streptomyces sp. RKND-216]|uniref:DUF3152 domain-containing protein n=1 Tax=Streptomyces sp. RKND-216 TaxID=2562581 RepID=UPI002492995B|nr:DUF3152 domain-containing protein [Streptomyces sp. RKND-216]
MGRHSRKRNAPPETPARTVPEAGPVVGAQPWAAGGPDGAAAARPAPPPDSSGPAPFAPGSLRRPAVPRPYPGERSPAGAPYPGPAAYGTPPGGTPQARGGHPQHREHGGAWGGGPATGPPPTVAGPRSGGPRPGVPRSGAAPGPRYGPRQDYLDAFDDDVFAAGSASRSAPPPEMPGRRASGAVGGGHGAPPPRAEDPWDSASPGPDGDHEGGHEGDHDDPETGPQRARTKGRTFTGVAAAAVTTALAIVVAGQVTGLEQRPDNRDAAAGAGEARGGDGESSRRVPRPTPSDTQAARPLTYAERIATVLPLDPDLHGTGEFSTVEGREEGDGRGEVVRYRVQVEKELPLDAELFAEAVHRTLNDDRSWAHDGARSFQRVASDDADFVITLASPGTTGAWCAKSGLDTTVQNVSCDSAATNRIMINAWRWAQGSETFGDDRIREYREMLINHEVGHRLGLGHRFCGSDGALAPVMMQQTKTLTTGAATCRPNAWPHPEKDG